MGLQGLWWLFDRFCFVLFSCFFFFGFCVQWVWTAEGSGGMVVIVCLVVEKVRERQG